jgi:hypothetical protein
MPDEAYLTTTIAGVAMPRLLFPLEPQPNETLLGFVVRCIERNRLGTPVAFMRTVGLELKAKGDFLTRLQAELPALARALSMSVESLEGLWGAHPPTQDRKRRLGGVWLRPALVEQARRRAPPSIEAGAADDARWLIRPIAFCSTSWEMLIDHCPSRWCGKVLTWPRADSLHLCRHCGTPLTSAPKRKVPHQHRRSLEWVITLFSKDEDLRQAAVRRVPTSFKVETETEVFELVLALRHALKMSGAGPDDEIVDDPGDEGEHDDLHHLVAAARFVLEYPRSHWDTLQRHGAAGPGAFHFALRRIAHNSNVPIVRSELTRLNRHEEIIRLFTPNRREPSREMSARAAASELETTPGALRQLVEAKLLTPVRSRGRAQRSIPVFAEEDIRALKTACEEGISCRGLRTITALPEIAIEQLVALGHLEFHEHPAAEILKGGRQLRADTANTLLEEISRLPRLPTANGWITLDDAFTGVGGREKPWGAVLGAWLRGTLPAGLVRLGGVGSRALAISTAVAQSLVMGGPSSQPWLSFELNDYAQSGRDWFSSGETATHLNCSAVEIAYLLERGHLHRLSGHDRTRYGRSQVDAFAREWMNTREAAARLGVSPRHVWQELEQYRMKSSLGRGFHRRGELEPIVELEVEVLRAQSMRAVRSSAASRH